MGYDYETEEDLQEQEDEKERKGQPRSITDEGDTTTVSGATAPVSAQPTAPATSQPVSITGPSEPAEQPARSIAAGPLDQLGPAGQREQQLLANKPEYHGWKKALDILGRVTGPGRAIEQGTGLGTLGYEAQLAQAERDAAAERAQQLAPLTGKYTQARTEEQEAKATQERARAEAALHPPPKEPKPEDLKQEYADAVMDAIKRGVNPAQDPKVGQLSDAITSLQKQPAAPRDMNAKPGTLDGKPAWGIQTEQGWIDPETRQVIHGFKPQPTFAETGLYEPVQIPVAGGGMQPGVFDKRTGTTRPVAPERATIPKAAQKEIDENLATARGFDRLEKAQGDILKGVQEHGEPGPMGGGPYLNGPESMQFIANHIAMTFGAVKGARVGRDIIQEHVKARDLGQELEAIAQHVLSGGVITYQQAQQMAETAKINRKTAWAQAKQAAENYGQPDAVKLPSDLSGEAPTRPQGVPKEAVWNPQVRRWQMPKKTNQ